MTEGEDDDFTRRMKRPPTPEELQWVRELPPHLTDEALGKMNVRQWQVLLNSSDLTEAQRNQAESYRRRMNERLSKAVAQMPALKRARESLRQLSESVSPAIELTNGADEIVRRTTDMHADLAGLAAAQRRERDEEIQRQSKTLEALQNMSAVMESQVADSAETRALTRFNAVMAFLAIAVAVVLGTWTFSRAWEWTALSGVLCVILGLGLAGVLGAFNPRGSK